MSENNRWIFEGSITSTILNYNSKNKEDVALDIFDSILDLVGNSESIKLDIRVHTK